MSAVDVNYDKSIGLRSNVAITEEKFHAKGDSIHGLDLTSFS